MRAKKLSLSMICLLLVFASVIFGQEQPYRLQSNGGLGTGLSFEFWKAGNDRVTELAIPVSFLLPINERFRLYAMTSPAFSNLNTGVSYSLGGMSDVKWGGHYFLSNRTLITFGMNLPTGKSGLESEEYSVANVLAMPAFNFRVPNFGQGLDVHLGLNMAQELGDFIVGAGVSYIMKGGFQAYSGYDDIYNPGDEITVSTGIDKALKGDVRLTGDILYTIYFDDTWAGEQVFRSGNRLLVQLMSTFKLNLWDMVVLIRNRSKGKNRTGSGEIFDTERKNTNMNQLEVQGIGTYPVSEKTLLKGIVELKFYTNNDYGTGGATLLGFGGGGMFRLTPRMDFNGELRCYFGSLEHITGATGVFGVKIFGGLTYTL